MLPRTSARLGAALLTSTAKRRVSQPCRLHLTRHSLLVDNSRSATGSHNRFCYSTLTANDESTTLERAIEQHNLAQARKSFELINRGNDNLSRETIRSLLLIARKSRKQSDLVLVQDIVNTMETRFGLAPQAFEYHALMYAYGVHNRPEKAHNVLEQMSQHDIKANTFTYNTLLGCYKRAGDTQKALQLLDEMMERQIPRDVGSYNTLIHLLADTDREMAYQLYDKMQHDGVMPDNYTFSTMLNIATKANNTTIGDRVYADILVKKNANIDLYTLNNMLAYKANAAQDLQGALDLFYTLPKSLRPDVVTYNLLLDACLKLDKPEQAFKLFDEMHNKAGCAPDVVTYGALMDAEARLGNVEGALKRFDEMIQQSIAPNDRVLSSLANLASQEKDSTQLDRILTIVEQHSNNSPLQLDTQAYNGLLSGLAKQGRSLQAQNLYDKVFRYNTQKADIATYTNLMLAYINDELVDDAMDIYYELREFVHGSDAGKERFNMDATFYTTLISAMTRLPGQELDLGDRPAPNYAYTIDDTPIQGLDGRSQPMLLTALALFNDMRRSMIRPNAHVYTAILHACAKYKDAYVLEQVHKLIRMDLYFDPDTAVYNALMNAYNRVGDGHIVLQMWEMLALSSAPETAIDQTTVSIVLDSCGHNGYNYHARDIWHTLKQSGFELNTNNYCSYVECLCRSKGRDGWEEAKRVVDEEMRPAYSANSLVDPRPLVDDKTVNTLISFAKKKDFSQDEIEALELWKNDILHHDRQ
ncbi:hypothetical protein O0I10_012175 [Lichtheimia ornata]|uniref:Pentacotripeptide-repeat region of PRORP domain-containing protein n=1 Tax=Lichtheimia ornata TaxID=688661 RepID=A0AAD7UT28_9FUNG|nr:uncharacterized protein O0I10_012175 [Lichtheimia ornata]KAJ8652214.1 hypothetical protein O0I10_012175 [Lichtheimia ornata]